MTHLSIGFLVLDSFEPLWEIDAKSIQISVPRRHGSDILPIEAGIISRLNADSSLLEVETTVRDVRSCQMAGDGFSDCGCVRVADLEEDELMHGDSAIWEKPLKDTVGDLED